MSGPSTIVYRPCSDWAVNAIRRVVLLTQVNPVTAERRSVPDGSVKLATSVAAKLPVSIGWLNVNVIWFAIVPTRPVGAWAITAGAVPATGGIANEVLTENESEFVVLAPNPRPR